MREQERSKALPVYPNSFPTILSPDCLRAFAHAIHSLNPHFISSSLKYFQLAVQDHSVKNNGSQRLPLSRPLLLLFSHWVVSHSLWPHGLQPPRLPCPSLSPGVCSNSCPLSRWCHRTISSSVTPFSTCLLSQPQGLFQRVGSSHQVAKVLELQLQHQSF